MFGRRIKNNIIKQSFETVIPANRLLINQSQSCKPPLSTSHWWLCNMYNYLRPSFSFSASCNVCEKLIFFSTDKSLSQEGIVKVFFTALVSKMGVEIIVLRMVK